MWYDWARVAGFDPSISGSGDGGLKDKPVGGQGVFSIYLSSLRLESVGSAGDGLRPPLSGAIPLVSTQHTAYFYRRNR